MNASRGGPPKQPVRNPIKEYELVLYCAAVLLAAGTKRSFPAHAESGIFRTLLFRFSWRDIASSRVAQPQANRDYESFPIQDEPEGGGSFQHKMSLERVAC